MRFSISSLVSTSGQGQEIQNQALQNQALCCIPSECVPDDKTTGGIAHHMCLEMNQGSRQERQSHQGRL